MSKPSPKSSPTVLPEELIDEEALRVARSIQKPGQTKEQTKLIAQGIAKGIALYKKQQAVKERDRDKSRKRALKTQQAKLPAMRDHETDHAAREEGIPAALGPGPLAALLSAGVVLTGLAIFHTVRMAAGWSLVLGPFAVPMWVSAAAAVISAGVAGWSFIQAARLDSSA